MSVKFGKEHTLKTYDKKTLRIITGCKRDREYEEGRNIP
jgi:hypothetical protein